MDVIKTDIEGLLIIQPRIFKDIRGYFFESYNVNSFSSVGIDEVFIQDNESSSSKGVLRGLHFQKPPFAQGKLVRVVHGKVLDVAVDLRKASPTYGKHYSIELSTQNKTMFWIPPGFAHGFVALEDDTTFTYKCTQVYHQASEGCLLWNDPELNIDWTILNPIVSEKDNEGSLFLDFQSPF
jgi:dTDP-4-dehydrorhamnose 3,5-epimerase